MSDSNTPMRCGKCDAILTPKEPDPLYIQKGLPPAKGAQYITCQECGTVNRFPEK